jgi:hypothetical protein
MLIVSPVKYTDLSVVSDRERYDNWKAALLVAVSSLAEVAFVMIGMTLFAGKFEAIAWHGASVELVVSKPNTRIAVKISRTNLIIILRLRNLRLF